MAQENIQKLGFRNSCMIKFSEIIDFYILNDIILIF